MDEIIYERRTDIRADIQPNGWAEVRLPEDGPGIALDPVLLAIWSAAEGRTLSEVAETAQVSTYLASCAAAVLRYAGLLQGDEATHLPGEPPPTQSTASSSVSVLVTHRHAGAHLDHCVESVLDQEYAGLVGITVISSVATVPSSRTVRLVECEDISWAQTWTQELARAEGETILVLDSRLKLAPGSLAEMVHALELPGRVAAVTPRIMCERWPRFVVRLGEWRDAWGQPLNPYAGHLDVGQFQRRWHEVPAIRFSAGLISREALRRVGMPDAEHGLDGIGQGWCHRARQSGYHVLGAAQALALGPWPKEEVLAQIGQGPPPQLHETGLGSVPPGPGPMVHEGLPALTVDHVRATYGHYPTIAPHPIHGRFVPCIAFVSLGTKRHTAMARALSKKYSVNWLVPRIGDEEAIRLSCEAASVVVTTARLLEKMAFLQAWHRPILVDMQPPITFIESPELWPQTVDGLICASEEEQQHWREILAAKGHSSLRRERGGSLPGDLVMLSPTGVEPLEGLDQPPLRALHPEIEADEQIILWYGGLTAFDDPLTAIRAVGQLRESGNKVVLLFAAFEEEDEPDKACLMAATRLAAKLDLTGSILFAEQIPASFENSYLSGADLAIMVGTDTLEARLHEPAGLTACIGSGLPMVLTSGHAGSSLVQHYGLGQAVPVCDVDALAHTLHDCLETPRPAYQDRFEAARNALAWSETIDSLMDLCQEPRFALHREASVLLDLDMLLSALPEPTSVWALPAKTWQTLSELGVRSTVREAIRYVRWKAGM